MIMLRIKTHQMYNGKISGDHSQATPSMATKFREAIAPSIFRLGCVIFFCCKASAMALDRPNQGGTQPTRMNHSGFKSPATIQTFPSTSTHPSVQHNTARRKTRQGPQPKREIRCFKHNRCCS